jgi:NADPH:quinone reductase-like Zn-dependent oxidoreductase
MVRVVEFDKPGAPEVLTLKNVPVPEPGAGQVRIRVKALGLNRAESMWREDHYIEAVKFPARLGYEAAGVIDATGPGVSAFAVGDAVNTIPSFSMNEYGMYGELVLAPVYSLVRQPPTLSPVEAASIWMMFITAYGALIEDAKLAAGDVVLIPGASSSVGLAAIQIANSVGATPVALTRTHVKRQRLIDAGASAVIATEEQDLLVEVAKLTDGKGARVVFDPVGGPNLSKLVEALSFQGIFYIYGALSPEASTLPLLTMIGKMVTIKGHNIWSTSGDPARQKQAVQFVLEGLNSGKLTPVIDKEFCFDDNQEAHRYLEKSEQFGKIVVTV